MGRPLEKTSKNLPKTLCNYVHVRSNTPRTGVGIYFSHLKIQGRKNPETVVVSGFSEVVSICTPQYGCGGRI